MDDVRQLALVPLRDVVLCPGSELPIYVGRDATIKAIRFAKANHEGYVAVFSQVNAETNGPITAEDLYNVGTLAKIAASIEMTDQSIKGMLEGSERIRLKKLEIIDGVPIAFVTPLPTKPEISTISEKEQTDILALLSTWCVDFSTASERPELDTIRSTRDIIPVANSLSTLVSSPRIDGPGKKRDWSIQPTPRYRELLNEAVRRRQKALEESSYERKIMLLIEAMTFDLASR